MNSSNCKSALLLLLLTLYTKTISADDVSWGIEEGVLIEKRISIYQKYDYLIRSSIDILKGATTQTEGLEDSLQHTIEYADDLETNSLEDIDRITVQNEKYWKAILVQSENQVLATRLFFLLREGLLKRAEMVLLFCYYYELKGYGLRPKILNGIASDIKAIKDESDRIVKEGIEEWDRGNRHKAIELYHKALTIYPKNPWALYEISLDYCTRDQSDQLIWNEKVELYYSLICFLDPGFMAAYQGQLTPEVREVELALRNKVMPSYKKLWNGEEILQSMRQLADGYFEMQEYEFSLYAYKYLLFSTYQGGFNQELITKMSSCFVKLKMNQMIDFLSEYLSKIEQLYGSKR